MVTQLHTDDLQPVDDADDLDTPPDQDYDPSPADIDMAQDLDDDSDPVDANEVDWDEPEQLSEYDGELRQPLYVIDDEDDYVLGNELRIDRWVATKLATYTKFQQRQITRLLGEFSDNRLRRWLPWLDKQQWTGDSLLLFLDFWGYWDLNQHWWEYSFWDNRLQCWYLTRSRYSLSLDDSYDLIQLRTDCRPSEVIDETWFDDWHELALWQRGFYSFASFAVFRAKFKPGERWQLHLNSDDPDDAEGYDVQSNKRINGCQTYRYGAHLWFSEQDWYDSNEWHDDLGW